MSPAQTQGRQDALFHGQNPSQFDARSVLTVREREGREERQVCEPEGQAIWRERRWRLFSTFPRGFTLAGKNERGASRSPLASRWRDKRSAHSDDDGTHEVALLPILFSGLGMFVMAICTTLHDGKVRGKPDGPATILKGHHFLFPLS